MPDKAEIVMYFLSPRSVAVWGAAVVVAAVAAEVRDVDVVVLDRFLSLSAFAKF